MTGHAFNVLFFCIDKSNVFSAALKFLHRRIALFTGLLLAKLDAMAIKHELQEIGRLREKGQ
jgi:hypothetical protein